MCTPAILKINVCCLTLAISHFVLLSQSLFIVACLKKSGEKERVQRKAFIFQMAGVHSSFGRSVKWYSCKSDLKAGSHDPIFGSVFLNWHCFSS